MRNAAAYAAGNIGGTEKYLPSILEKLGHEKPETRKHALVLLGYLVENAQTALPHIIEVLQRETEKDVKAEAAQAINRIAERRLSTENSKK